MKPYNNCSKCAFLSECTRINFKHNEEHCRWHFKDKARMATDELNITPIKIDVEQVMGTIENLINEVE